MSEQPPERFTPEEKLRLVEQGMMDPKELGLPGADVEENPKLEVLPDAPKRPVFGTTILFRAGVVPLELRALWAKQESKILPFDTDGWMGEHKNEFPVQSELHCGNLFGKFTQTFQDPVLGLVQMMHEAADKLEKAYAQPEAVPHDPDELTTVPNPQEKLADVIEITGPSLDKTT